MSKTMSINSYLTISKWFKFDHFDQMIRSDFNLSEGLNFHRSGQTSPPLGRSVAHHSKRPIHPIYSQLFSRERETTQNFFMTLWLWFIWFYTMEKRVRERGEGGLWAAEFRKSSMDAISLSCQKKKNEQYVPSQPPGPGHWRKSNRTNALPVTDSQLQSQFIGLVLIFLLWVFEFFKNYHLLF